MKIINVEQNSAEWMTKRLGKITGSRVGNTLIEKIANKTELQAIVLAPKLVGIEDKKEIAAIKKEVSSLSQRQLESMIPVEMYEQYWHPAQKKEYFRLLAEMMGYFDDPNEDDRSRGHRLESKGIEEFEKRTGIKTVVAGLCTHDEYEEIALSPDRLIELVVEDTIIYPGGVEMKSPGVVNHLQIVFTNVIPSDYIEQLWQYFIVDKNRKYVYFVSYNPVVTSHPMVIIKVNREDVEKDIQESFEQQVNIIKHLKADMLKLAF